jgi:UDPglucose 6-dehydrogenase
MEILHAVESVNSRQKLLIVFKFLERIGSNLSGMLFAVWWLSFNPDSDDMREAPSRVLMEALWAAGAKVQAYDPEAMHEVRRIYAKSHDLLLTETKEAALDGADALAIVTEWQAFRAPDTELMKALLRQPVIFDGRNLYDPLLMSKEGFIYQSVGRPSF